MTNTKGEDLSKLYPKPKTHQQRRREQQQREQRQRPRYPAVKISLWSTLGVAIALGVYQVVYSLMIDAQSSAGQAAFGVAITVILLAIAVLVLAYLWGLIKHMIERLQSWTLPLTLAAAIVLIVSGTALTLFAQYDRLSLVLVLMVLAFNLVATHLVVTIAAISRS